MTLVLMTALIAFLAFSNGANDVSKGVATLFGSGVTRSRWALLWGMAGNVSGGLMAILLGGALARTFGGGLLAPGFDETPHFMMAVILGASLWVFLSTWTGWPVSTTHALIGAMMGSAIVLSGSGSFKWNALWGKAIIPLLVSPFLAMGFAFVFSAIRRILVKTRPLILLSGRTVLTDKESECPVEQSVRNPWTGERILKSLHWMSAGVTSFARGANDVPKMAALLIVAFAGSSPPAATQRTFVFSMILVSVSMGIGGIWKGLRILTVLSHRVAPLTPSTGMIANLSTAIPTLLASTLGIPVSTTHVSAGALFGIRLLSGRDGPEHDALRSIVGAWLVTLPFSALISAVFTVAFSFF